MAESRTFRIEPCPDDDKETWNEFIAASPQGSLFCDLRFLATLRHGYRALWVKQGEERVAALCFDLNAQGDSAGDDGLIYSGLMFAERLSTQSPSDLSKRFAVTELVATWLANRFRQVNIRLSPHFEDIRPFSWHNYGSDRPEERFTVSAQYTSYLAIKDVDIANRTPDIFFRRLHPLRRRNLKRGISEAAATKVETNAGMFIDAYSRLMASQHAFPSAEETAELERRIIHLVDCRIAAQFITYNAQSIPIYTTVFGWDRKRAYYLYGAPAGDCPEPYQGTICFLHAFEWLAARGLETVDLEGVNSPQRGRFKLSFGGTLLPLFVIER